MVTIDGIYEGSLHCSVVHQPSGATIPTDAPRDNLGLGAAFSPTDLVAASLGSCMVTTMAIVAKKRGIEMPGAVRFRVTKEMSADAPRRIVRLAAEIWMPIPRTPEAASLYEPAAASCPVHVSLHPSIEKPLTFHWA